MSRTDGTPPGITAALGRLMDSALFRRAIGSGRCADAWRYLGAAIAPDAVVGTRTWMRVPANVTIGRGCKLDEVVLDSWGPIRIGNNVLINNAEIYTAEHDVDNPYLDGAQEPVTVGDHTWVIRHVLVMPGVTIGRCAVVGTGSVVTRDVADYAVVGGNPARFIRERARIDYRYRPSGHWRDGDAVT
jgi:maltose O-acetyltransferase